MQEDERRLSGVFKNSRQSHGGNIPLDRWEGILKQWCLAGHRILSLGSGGNTGGCWTAHEEWGGGGLVVRSKAGTNQRQEGGKKRNVLFSPLPNHAWPVLPTLCWNWLLVFNRSAEQRWFHLPEPFQVQLVSTFDVSNWEFIQPCLEHTFHMNDSELFVSSPHINCLFSRYG